MNKPFGVCLQPVLQMSFAAKAFRHKKEKVGCKRGIEISISFSNKAFY